MFKSRNIIKSLELFEMIKHYKNIKRNISIFTYEYRKTLIIY